jgi:hypothetical protein
VSKVLSRRMPERSWIAECGCSETPPRWSVSWASHVSAWTWCGCPLRHLRLGLLGVHVGLDTHHPAPVGRRVRQVAVRHLPAFLAGALERGEPWGVWGGQLLVQGTLVARKRPRAVRERTTLLPDTRGSLAGALATPACGQHSGESPWPPGEATLPRVVARGIQ